MKAAGYRHAPEAKLANIATGTRSCRVAILMNGLGAVTLMTRGNKMALRARKAIKAIILITFLAGS